MKKKKIFYIAIAGLFTWYLFIWCKYSAFNKVYTQEQIDKEFAVLKMDAPLYDSINIRGYSIKYISNKKNYSEKGDVYGKKKSYLILLHDNDKNAGNFLDYFKDKELNKKFHIIAIDRIRFGNSSFIKPEKENNLFEQEQKEFGKIAEYASSVAVKEILNSEGQYMEEVRIVANGSGAITGLQSYLYENQSFSKVFLFDGDFNERFLLSKVFSKVIVSPIVSFAFPRAFVSKQQDLLLTDERRGKDFENMIQNVKSYEDKEIESEGYMYRKGFKSVFFLGLNKNQEKRITNISGKSNFIFADSEVNIYKSPREVLKTIFANDIYTLDFNRIK
ncbi:MAG: hypothetical protein EOP00_28935 [Pedobacter sp.]|nr:MAG: hypothetical protein EOP00_28935 [Pedobacter sp.]